MSIRLSTNLRPANNNTWPLIEDIHVKGGFRVVTTVVDLDSVNQASRKAGMMVRTSDDGKLWSLDGDLINWTELNLSGAQGLPGPAGPAGSTGPAGPLGLTGRRFDSAQLHHKDTEP